MNDRLKAPLMTLLMSVALAFGLTLSAHAEDDTDDPMEGVHYTLIQPAQPTSVGEGKVEVVEMFWYGCPHCFHFEPYVKSWLKTKPDNVVFVRIPAVLTEKWEAHARAYYAAEILGVVDKIHDPMFHALHIEKRRIFTEEQVLDFVEQQGVDRTKFEETYKSFAVSIKIQRSIRLAKAYGISGVPSMIINGKYLTSGRQTGSNTNLIKVTNRLAQIEADSANKLASSEPAADKQ